MNSYTLNQIDNKYPALGIVLAVCTLLIGLLLQYTQRIIQIDRYLVTLNTFKGNTKHHVGSPRLIKFASVMYYIGLLLPLLLLLAWSILLFIGFGVTPGLPVLLHGLFVLVLILPSDDRAYYYKLLALSLLFLASQLVTLFTSELWTS